MNIKIGKGGSGKINSTKGGSGKLNEKKYIDLLPGINIFPTDQLVAFWDLENANSLSTIPASYGSFTLNADGYSSVNGKINNGLEFANSSEGLWTNEALWNLLTNPTSFSVSFWIKLPYVSTAITLMGSAFGNLGFHFDYINDDSYYGDPNYGFTMNMSTVDGPYAWERTFAKEFASANQWYHIVGTYDYPTTTMRLYVNGALKDTNTNAIIGENSLPDVNGFAINGSVLDGAKEYGGNEIFDAIGFWKKALNQNEINGLYNNGNGTQFSVQSNLTFLFDPVFYKNQIQNERNKILVEGCSLPYVNGIYSQIAIYNNHAQFRKDDDIYMEIFFETDQWWIVDAGLRDYDSPLFYKIDVGASSIAQPFWLDWSTPDGGYAYDNNETPPTISQLSNIPYKSGGRLDPVFLEQIRNYQIDNTIPNESAINALNPSSPQRIVGAAFNTKKAEIKNNTFSYIKYSDNTDVEQKKLNRWYQSISKTQSEYGITPPKDSKYPLLKVRRNDSQPIFEIGAGKNYTLNMFIKLQRPIQHFREGTSYIVREKRGIFCTAFSPIDSRPFSIGYRSPYYNITGRPSYKSVFNNFSFVFSFGGVGYDATFGRPISRNLMTDYKFNFGEMYMLTISSYDNYIGIYINGELQEVAIVPFNPLVNPSYKIKGVDRIELQAGDYNVGVYERNAINGNFFYGPAGMYLEYAGGLWYAFDPEFSLQDATYISSDLINWYEEFAINPPYGQFLNTYQYKKLYKTRRDEMPLGPGFYKKDGTIYTPRDTESFFGGGLSINELIFGKSSLAYGSRNYPNNRKKRRYLNNLDIGVISSYNIALSQSDISQIYNNFRYRYI